MNKAIAYDTHKFVKHLVENGFSEQQAEGLVSGQAYLLNDNLATKADLDRLEAKQDRVKAEIIIWVASMLIVQFAAITGLIVNLT